MLGGLLIGLVRSLGSGYVGEKWTTALIFALLTTLLQLQANQRQATEQQDLIRRGQIADRFACSCAGWPWLNCLA